MTDPFFPLFTSKRQIFELRLVVRTCSINTKNDFIFIQIPDTVSTVGGLAATGITIAAVASVPMLPIIATGALVTGLGCAVYSVGRSTFKLVSSFLILNTPKVVKHCLSY